MIGVFNSILFDENEIFRGNEFTLNREYIYAGEYTTCTGKKCGDLVGWRYADMTLTWDNLPQDQLDVILSLTGQEVELTFENEQNETVTEKVIPRLIASRASRITDPHGDPAWVGVSLDLTFTEAHDGDD